MKNAKRVAALIGGASVLTAVFGITGCSDAHRENIARLGNKHEIVCYSGGKEVIRSTSTGKPFVGEGVVTWSDGKDGFGSSADCVYRTTR